MIEFSDAERGLLEEILDQAWEHLRVEINRTDTLDYKEFLRQREQLLESVMSKVKGRRISSQPVDHRNTMLESESGGRH